MHDDQLAVDADLVRGLIAEQFPKWAGFPVTPVSSGATVNAIFRVGTDLVARLPLRQGDPVAVRAELEREATALEELAGIVSVPVPRSVALGRPGRGYPLPWAVHTWLTGEIATPIGLAGSAVFADDLAALLAALRAAPTRGRTFRGGGRGGSLADHDEWMSVCLRESEGLLDVPALRARWRAYRELPPAGPDVMAHRDLHPGNVLVTGERLTGILDGGGFGAADPALDLVIVWHMLDAPVRARVRRSLGSGEIEWERGAGWAFQQSMGLVWYYRESNPAMSALGRTTLGRIMSEPGPLLG